MSALTIYPDNEPQSGDLYTDFSAIQKHLNDIGVQFERWTANCELFTDADQESILSAESEAGAR